MSFAMDGDYNIVPLPEEDPGDYFKPIPTFVTGHGDAEEVNVSFSEVDGGAFNTVLLQVGPKDGPYTTAYLKAEQLRLLIGALIGASIIFPKEPA